MERYPLRRLKLRSGEEHREPLTLEVEPFVVGGLDYVVRPSRVEAELAVQRAMGGDIFRLRFPAALEGPCMRCLGAAQFTLQLDGTEVHDGARNAPVELRSDYVEGDDLLVGAWARDLVGTGLPDRVLCRPDCEGLCVGCGLPLEAGAHDHGEVPADARWGALAALRDASPDGV
ncbi:MAG: DUF177 domain-containing protein [Thermoleophilia bacterium]|nr:DUF177 domain-containing protein [Thermoleophilia bacterium]